jgi:hypothetical protein
MRFVYATTIADDVCEVVGRGPTPEASHEAAQTQWISRWGESPVERGTARGGGAPAHSFHSEPRGRGVCQSRFEGDMWRHDQKAVMVIAEGRCKVVGEAKWNEFGCAQEPLPEGMRVLLCLIDGAERKQDLLRRWSGEAVPCPGKR